MAVRALDPNEATVWFGAVRQDWRTLRRAPPAIRACRGLVLEAAAQDPRALQHAMGTLWADSAFSIECLRVSGGRAAPFLPSAHRQDRAVMMEAVALDGLALRHVYGTELQSDPELVLTAVRQNWAALQFASEDLRLDRELALEAVRISWEAVTLLPAELHADRGVMLEALKQSGEALRYATEELRADPALVQEAEKLGWTVAATGEERNYHSLNFAEEVRLPPMGSSSWAT